MSEHDFSALYDLYPDTIARMPDTFTSHEFILCLAHQHQSAYIEALYAYRNIPRRGKVAPFLMVHGILARRLLAYPDLIEKIPSVVPSKDIFGNDNTARQWRRRR